MIEVLESEYVEMARLKGLPERVVVVRHALPNALAPAIQAIALSLAYLAGGIVVVEYVFDYPGIGAALVDAVHEPGPARRADGHAADRRGLRRASTCSPTSPRSSSARACGRRSSERAESRAAGVAVPPRGAPRGRVRR